MWAATTRCRAPGATSTAKRPEAVPPSRKSTRIPNTSRRSGTLLRETWQPISAIGANVWGTYVVPLPRRAGSVTFGLLQQIGSGVPYGAVAPLTATTFGVQNPGYVTPGAPNGTIDYYFTARDAFRTATTYRTDLSINYGRRLRAGDAQPELFFHGEVLNIFNQFQLCGCGGSAFSNGGSVDISTHPHGRADAADDPCGDLSDVQSVYDSSRARHALGPRHRRRLRVRRRR